VGNGTGMPPGHIPSIRSSSQTMGGEMKLVSVNVSLPREVSFQGGMVNTGIFKEPVMGRVMLR